MISSLTVYQKSTDCNRHSPPNLLIKWPDLLMARKSGFHPGNRSSILRRATNVTSPSIKMVWDEPLMMFEKEPDKMIITWRD